ncbi:GIY-YIG nuclease family protein [Bacillus mycoides]|uniref:GIY-YIG nuclease family protein n=1 Tax=Bacillus mycoides TaxID=1405 RepID=UPI001C01A359|nr:GIY-YIG nuclease family protein [Bacillus mycoides]QWI10076.1 hypothetical protein EXW47_06530 [Bacillus mycoides]
MIIYKATNSVNGKVYIGLSTLTLEERIKGHYYHATNNHKNYYFYNAIRKYGWDAFTWEVIDQTDDYDELLQLEIHYIAKHNSYNNGYNSTKGGDGTKGVDHAGEKNSRAILTKEDVLLILDLLIVNKKTTREIGEMFGVDKSVINSINRGKTWTHLYEQSPLEQGRKRLHADVSGERNTKAQLTDEQVYDIKHKLTHGATREEIEKEYGVSKQLLQRIIRGVHWSHVVYEGFFIKVEMEEEQARDKEVRIIKEMMADGMTNHEIKQHFDDKYTNIFLSEIRTNKTYKHVTIDRPIGKGDLKLTEDDVREIKKLLLQGVKQKTISERFGVSRALITRINTGQAWSYLNIDESQIIPNELKTPRQSVGRKLTEDDVREIKRLLKQGVSHGELAKQFGIARSGISKISTGKRWSHITI